MHVSKVKEKKEPRTFLVNLITRAFIFLIYFYFLILSFFCFFFFFLQLASPYQWVSSIDCFTLYCWIDGYDTLSIRGRGRS